MSGALVDKRLISNIYCIELYYIILFIKCNVGGLWSHFFIINARCTALIVPSVIVNIYRRTIYAGTIDISYPKV